MATIAFGRKAFTPTETFLVGTAEGAQYSTIAAAIAAASETPRDETNRAAIYLSPGQYDEDIWLPSFIYLIGVAAGVHIRGNSNAGGVMLDVGQSSWIEKITVAPTNNDKDAGIAVRDATMAVGNVISTPINGTLIVAGDLIPTVETFTFTGEATTNAIVATINATAVNIAAYNRFGKVAILSKNDDLTIYAIGTANVALGFPTVDTTYSRAEDATVYISAVSVIGKGSLTGVPGQKKITQGMVFQDKEFCSCICNSVSVMGTTEDATGKGVTVERGTTFLNNIMVTANNGGGIGVFLQDDPLTAGNTQAVLGTILLYGNTTDLDGDVNTGYLIVYTNHGITLGANPNYQANGSMGAISAWDEWFLGSSGLPAAFSIQSLSEYVRRPFITADELYSPIVGGAADAEVGTLEQKVKEFVTAADNAVSCKRKHVDTVSGQVKTGETLSLKATISLAVNGGAGDDIRLNAKIGTGAIGEDIVAITNTTVSQTVDVSGYSADDRFDVVFNFTNAAAIADPDDMLEIWFQREGTHGDDDYGNSIYLWGLEYEF